MIDSVLRARRERRTVSAMIEIYCRGNHAPAGAPCAGCLELLEYAHRRLDACPFAREKPTCARCTVHCYDRAHRERVRAVMRYSGPRMLVWHPVLALLHAFRRS